MTRPWRRLKNIITFRATGAYSLKEYRRWFTSKGLSLWWRFITLAIAVMPACFANLFMLSCLKMIKRESLMTVDDLENNENNIMNIVRRKRALTVSQ